MFVYCPPKDLQDLKSETFPDGRRYYTSEKDKNDVDYNMIPKYR